MKGKKLTFTLKVLLISLKMLKKCSFFGTSFSPNTDLKVVLFASKQSTPHYWKMVTKLLPADLIDRECSADESPKILKLYRKRQEKVFDDCFDMKLACIKI